MRCHLINENGLIIDKGNFPDVSTAKDWAKRKGEYKLLIYSSQTGHLIRKFKVRDCHITEVMQ